MEASVLFIFLTTFVLAKVEADEKVCENAENVDRDKENDEVVAVLGV